MILEQIAADTRLRLIEEKKLVSPEEMKEKALALAADETFPFEKMLKEPGIHYICEVKKASPSKGLIAEDFPYLQIAKEYEAAGADAISCLTEPKYFLGKKEYLKAITDEVSIPVLRKDFTVDEYQIYEAKTLGAGVVLLICALLDTEMIRSYIEICDRLGLSALVEVHDENEMDSAIKAGARLSDRCKQPKLKRFHGRYLQQHPPEKSCSGKCTFRGRKRDQNSERYSGIKRCRCKWCADR